MADKFKIMNIAARNVSITISARLCACVCASVYLHQRELLDNKNALYTGAVVVRVERAASII